MKKKILVLHSGGLDSTVCLFTALNSGSEVVSLGIDYGQRHRVELEYANNQCALHNIERKLVKLEWDKPIREMPVDRSIEEIKANVSSAFLPGRNLTFFSIACAEAAGVGADEVWTGINAVDFSGYPDCTPDFFNSFRSTLSLAMPDGPQLLAPLLFKTKPEIALMAKNIGINKGDTWSCYRPNFHTDGISPCAKCDACKLHNYAWENSE